MDGRKWWMTMVVWLGVGLGGLAAEPLRVFIWSEYLDPEAVQAR